MARLKLYRRHLASCKHKGKGVRFDRCACPIWIRGTWQGKAMRRSLDVDTWEAAEKLKDEIQHGPKREQSITITAALDAFIADCEARNLNSSTRRKYRNLRQRFLSFMDAERRTSLADCDAELCGKFRKSWKLGPRTAAKELERLRSFFNFAIANEWISKNPAQAIKAPEIKPAPTLPFSDAEVTKLLARADFRTNVFFRVLLHSGLRIIDAAALRPEKIQDGKLFLYSQKTGVPVRIPLPPDLLADLAKLTPVAGFYFAVESDDPVNIAEYYRRKLYKTAIAAGLAHKKPKGAPRSKNPIHPHRFRDTFAVRLLEKGVPLETVSILLGHTDIKTTQRSYAPWVKSLQDNLEIAVAKTWAPPALIRIK